MPENFRHLFGYTKKLNIIVLLKRNQDC